MPVLDVLDKNNVKVREAAAPEGLFIDEPKPHVVHQVVLAQLAAQRQGTHKAQTRGEASGSTAKPWRQKGTSRARAGSRKSPLWGNSVIFGPVPHSYRQGAPRQLRRLALRSVLQSKLQEGAIKVVTDFDLTTPKTKEAVEFLKRLSLDGKVLAVVLGDERNFQLAIRNLPHVKGVRPSGVDLLTLLESHTLLFTEASLKAFTECHPYE